MKRRKFVTAGVFIAALLAAALAAASVGSAATKSSTGMVKKGQLVKGSWGGGSKPNGNAPGKNGFFTKTGFQGFSNKSVTTHTLAEAEAYGKLVSLTNRPTRGPHASGTVGSAPSGPISIPHIHSLPLSSSKVGHFDAQAQGLNEFWDEVGTVFGGGTPPDQAIAEGNGQVMEVVNTALIVTDNTFHHPLGFTDLNTFFESAILTTGSSFVFDPRAAYDGSTNRWFVVADAQGPLESNLFIAVSTTSDAFGAYAIYVLDNTLDGVSGCPAGCFGDHPYLGFDRYTLDLTVNSFDNASGALNGTQLYVIDKTALVGQVPFPTLWYQDFAAFDYPGFIGNTCGAPIFGPETGFCLASLSPAISPNMSFDPHNAGTEWMLQSLDPLASADNRIVQWALTGTAGVSFTPPLLFENVVTTQSYGYPLTNNCMVMPQMLDWVPELSVNQCGFAEQPANGDTPFCDFELFALTGGGGCEPGAIQANSDEMQQTMAVQSGSTMLIWGGLNTDALISDPVGVLHRRDAIAWFALSSLGNVAGQGYLGNFQNDLIFPSIAATSTSGGTKAAISYSVTGNNTYPSVALSYIQVHVQATTINLAVPGQDVLDDFCTDLPICGFINPINGSVETLYRPRFGDYSAAVSDGSNIYIAGEYAGSSCDDITFASTFGQCNPALPPIPVTPVGTPTPRGFFSNWATGMVRTHT